jgi:ABC-type nitrate/sulfonate/bicarbonate transport system substrate-binding protein
MGESGVTLDLVGTSSTAAAMQQLAAGSANIGSGGLTDPLRAIDKGAPISLLRVEAQVPPYTVWAKPTIKSVADLRACGPPPARAAAKHSRAAGGVIFVD